LSHEISTRAIGDRNNDRLTLELRPKVIMTVPVERRQTLRHELRRVAKLTTGRGVPVRYCLVVNLSEGGVRLSTTQFEIPDQFGLIFPGVDPADDGTYKVIWRKGNDVGAKHVEAIPNKADNSRDILLPRQP
jgi:PilZ domain